MHKQTGFTLIELMIVVAVIGILSATALPQYQRYLAKTEVSSAFATLSALKSTIETEVLLSGTFPDRPATSAGNSSLGIPKTRTGTIALTSDSDSDIGSITYQFNSSGVNSSVQDSTLTLSRDADGNWDCSYTNDSLTPASCS